MVDRNRYQYILKKEIYIAKSSENVENCSETAFLFFPLSLPRGEKKHHSTSGSQITNFRSTFLFFLKLSKLSIASSYTWDIPFSFCLLS